MSAAKWYPNICVLLLPCRLSSESRPDVRNVTAMLLKGLASHPIIGLKKEKKLFARVSWRDIRTGLLMTGKT